MEDANKRDDTKRYTVKRKSDNVVPYVKDIEVLILFHDKNKDYVEEICGALQDRKIKFSKGLEEVGNAYGKEINVIDSFDYVAVVLSKEFLKDLDLMDVLIGNYRRDGGNNKIIPLVVWRGLYEPEKQMEIVDAWKVRKENYKEKNLKEDFNISVAEEVIRMQQIVDELGNFMGYAANYDQKKKLKCSQKILDYICFESGREVPKKEHRDDNGAATKVVCNGLIQYNIASGNGTIEAQQSNK